MMDEIEILGQTFVSEVEADSLGAFDTSLAINALAELATRGVNTYEKDHNKAKSDSNANTSKAIADAAPMVPPTGGGSSFLTKMHAGVPTWGWMVGGAGVLTGTVLLIRSMRKKR